MTRERVGILHPGTMGVSLAATVRASGHQVYWASGNRSGATRERALQQQLVDVRAPEILLDLCTALVSICPPHAALEVAEWAARHGFRGLYLDANAIAPEKSLAIARLLENTGARYVDGGVIGGPAWKPGSTWLHLSGEHAEEAAALFAAGPLSTNILSREIGAASALKMCFAAQTKGATALLCASMAAAESFGVMEALRRQWADLGMAADADRQLAAAAQKAWRFIGEMEEIAATFAAAGLPAEFHRATAEIYCRLSRWKEPATPATPDILRALLEQPER